MAKKAIRPIRIEGQLAYVPLTKGYEAIIDAADVPLVDGFNWTADVKPHTVYAYRKSPRPEQRNITLHKTILQPEEGLEPDHRDCDGLNNRRENLRPASRAQNGCNRRAQKNNTSGVKGVSLHKPTGLWRARIGVGGKGRTIGYFKCSTAAAIAYAKASAAIHGEFGRAQWQIVM
jgi:hypothetical protein